MLQTFTVIPGGRQINAKASFFRYETSGIAGADESLRVRADGQDLGTYLPGDSIDLPTQASTWDLVPTNPSQSCVVRLGVGRVESVRLAGSVRVIDEITEALTPFYFSPSNAVQAYVATTILAPASNTKGVIVRASNATVQAGSGGTAMVGLLAAKSLPTSYQAPPQRWSFASRYNNTTTLQDSSEKTNKLIPAGWGLYAVLEIGGAAASIANGSIFYEPLA